MDVIPKVRVCVTSYTILFTVLLFLTSHLQSIIRLTTDDDHQLLYITFDMEYST